MDICHHLRPPGIRCNELVKRGERWMTDFEKTALREHRFWLQILGDHSRFIQDSLAPQEQREWERARYFMETFDQLLERVDRENLIEISQKAEEESRKLREFKLHLIERHLLGRVRISLGPAFMNHMVNELEEYLRILDYLKQGVNPPFFMNSITTYYGCWMRRAMPERSQTTWTKQKRA